MKRALSQLGTLTEQSINFLYSGDVPSIKNDSHIIRIDASNYQSYYEYHNNFALRHDMYWDADNLKKAMDQFTIFAYVIESKMVGSIFYKKGEQHQEIFGVFTESKDETIYMQLLRKSLAEIQDTSQEVNVTYFVDMENRVEIDVAEKLGFRVQDTYLCYLL